MRKQIIKIAIVSVILQSLIIDIRVASSASPGDLVINEIMNNPSAVSDSNGEWFELYNPTTGDIDIDGWTIKDNDFDSHVIDNGGPLVIPSGGYLVLGNNGDSATNGGVVVDYEYNSGWYLSNSADEVLLFDDSGVEIDRVEYDGGPVFPDPNGASMALLNPTLDNNVGSNWCTASTPYGDGDQGTPGAANDCVPTTPIYDIQFTNDPSCDSPYVNQLGVTLGVVTASFGGVFNLFIQDGTGPWSGLYLYSPSSLVSIGDLVEVVGEVSEYFGLTEIAGGIITVLSSGNPMPPSEVLSSGDVSQEQWESVMVRVENVMVTDEDLGFGEWMVDDGSVEVRVDDMGGYTYIPVDGDSLDFVQGPLFYSYGDFKIEPRDDNDISISPPTTEISVDIKPGSGLNPINVNSKGVLPVAILGTESFDIAAVDPSTLFLTWRGITLPPGVDDGAHPLRYAYEDVNEDGLSDIVLKFGMRDLYPYTVTKEPPGELLMTLMGETYDGIHLEGQDLVRIINKEMD